MLKMNERVAEAVRELEEEFLKHAGLEASPDRPFAPPIE
jgi:hypothetical protein